MIYKVVKYQGKWAVMDTIAQVYYFIGQGKKYCEEKATELNQII